ncbi:hypothetical protein [Streptomyces flavalbus]|uniref:Integral membrane protein n=1 Tax=Streptomyces flavalbus TaxID=2665155 RepID=A0ABW2WCZ2_9ACTN
MAHAAPRSGRLTPGKRDRKPDTDGSPRVSTDVFSERTHLVVRWVLPVLAGLVVGYWAAANRRSGGPVTGWNLLFGFTTALAFMVLCVAVRVAASRMKRELHALTWAVFLGGTFGFVYAQTDKTALRSAVMAAAVGAVVFAVLFYRYYTHEDAEGHRVP